MCLLGGWNTQDASQLAPRRIMGDFFVDTCTASNTACRQTSAAWTSKCIAQLWVSLLFNGLSFSSSSYLRRWTTSHGTVILCLGYQWMTLEPVWHVERLPHVASCCLMLPQEKTTMVTNNSERFRGHFGTVMNSQSKGLLVHFTVLACLLTGTVCGCVSEDAWPLIVCKKSSCQNVMPKLHKFAFLQFVWSDFTLHTCVDSLELHCSY